MEAVGAHSVQNHTRPRAFVIATTPGCSNMAIRTRSEVHLRWDSQAGNLEDRRADGTLPIGEAHYNTKLTDLDVVNIRASTESNAAVATRYDIAARYAWEIRAGKKRKDSEAEGGDHS